MMEDMNECGAAVTAVLLNQKTFIKDAVELVYFSLSLSLSISLSLSSSIFLSFFVLVKMS